MSFSVRICVPLFSVALSYAALAGDLQPLMATPKSIVIQDDFSKPHKLSKQQWQTRQGTRWAIEDGVLRGRESSPEYQAKKKDHFGYEPRISVPVTPPEFVVSFSIRFIDGKETSIVPFIEFGHHVCRIRFSRDGTQLLADHETMKLAEATDFVWQSGKWYHMLAEMKSGQFVLQMKDGPTLSATHDSFRQPPTSGGNGFGIAGPRNGIVELDDLRIWSVSDAVQPTWAKRQASFPVFKPIQVKEPKSK